MKFIAGLRVWGNWEIGENVLKVFLRLRGSANRRLDLFLPLIASISGRRCEAWGVGRENRCREDVGGQPRFPGAIKGVPLLLLVISGLATHGDGLQFLSRRCQHF